MQRFSCLIGFLALGTTACAITLNTPVLRFDSPESQGKLGKGYVAGSFAGDSDLTIIPDTTAQPPVDSKSYSTTVVGAVSSAVGITEGLDLGIFFPASASTNASGTAPLMLEAKYQFLGSHRIERTPGSFALAATLGLGGASDSKSDTNSLNSITANSDSDFEAIDVGAIAGYRWTSWYLLYSGIFFTDYFYSSTIHQSQNGVPTNNYTFSGNAGQTVLTVGSEFDFGHFVMRLEGAIASGKSGSVNNTDVFGGGQWGFQW